MPRTTAVSRVLSITALGALVFTVACQGAGTATDGSGEVVLETAQQRGSYAQGVGLGRQGRGMNMDIEAFVQGLRDGLTENERFSDDEMRQAMEDFTAFMSEASDAEAEANLIAGRNFLAENAQRDGVQVTASGLQYEVIREGDGARPSAADVVRVHYRGTTIDGELFDESYGSDPAEFPLAGVISGWTEGVQLMSVGSHYKFYIPTELAYDTNVRPGSVFGPKSALVFDVELLDIVAR